ncbi:hypothetical protein [Candidatus Chlorobium masyuteum]|uniref:hypothetical protein n=1 Tax=Candidatus Chlorobium masyuteum TaxID=2716876 RepID=UPI0014218C6E|nr:hypothetical protein [Candidatus Chlorobium masyuteum]
MAEQSQSPDIVKNVVGVLLFVPSIGIPVFFASVGIRIAGFLFNTAGSVAGAVAGQVSTVLGSVFCSGSASK